MPAPTVSTLIAQMKGYVTKRIGVSIWQKSFYDHIVRDEKDYLEIWEYIMVIVSRNSGCNRCFEDKYLI